MKRLIKRIIIIFIFFFSKAIFGQTKEDLKRQKLALEQEINHTSDLLKKTQKNKNKSLNYLKVLEAQIKNKEQLLITLDIEIKLLNKQVTKTNSEILNTETFIFNEEKNLENLKDEYAKIIYAFFRKRGTRSNLAFIISSDNFNQAYKRLIYLKQYSDFRMNQAKKITESQSQLIKKKEKLAQQKDRLIEETSRKKILIDSKKAELESINNINAEKHELVRQLSKSEQQFKKQIQNKKKKSKELDDEIRKIIEEEIKKSRVKNMSKGKTLNLTPEALELTSGFKNNKGNLPWPLEKGVIVERYGKQMHAVFSGVETFNNGVDIATYQGAIVRVVFDGIISRIFFIKGSGKAVLVNHGNYFTVYSGMSEVSVNVGEKVLTKEKLGVVLNNETEGKTELHFEIWEGYNKHDPSKWLYKAY